MKNELKAYLSPLERINLITIQDPRNIGAGTGWQQAMETYLKDAQVILLLVSSSFIASDHCYKMQMQRAIERHEHKEARVIPIILQVASFYVTVYSIGGWISPSLWMERVSIKSR